MLVSYKPFLKIPIFIVIHSVELFLQFFKSILLLLLFHCREFYLRLVIVVVCSECCFRNFPVFILLFSIESFDNVLYLLVALLFFLFFLLPNVACIIIVANLTSHATPYIFFSFFFISPFHNKIIFYSYVLSSIMFHCHSHSSVHQKQRQLPNLAPIAGVYVL